MRRVFGILGVLFLTASLAAVSIAVYRAWDPFAGARQHAAQQRLYQQWGTRPAALSPPHHVAAASRWLGRFRSAGCSPLSRSRRSGGSGNSP